MRITDMMNLLDVLSASPHYFCGKEWGQQMRIQILILGFKGPGSVQISRLTQQVVFTNG